MPKKSNFKWWDESWNPMTGCSKISAGCANCYAESISYQQKARGIEKYQNGFEPTLHRKLLDEPTHWRNPRRIFVCSMSDLFYSKVPFKFIDMVMDVIKSTPRHTYCFLTKRAARMEEYFKTKPIPANVWLGVTVENINTKSRIDNLRNLPAMVKFLSCEPLLESLGTINLQGIDWVIVGGESGNRARPMKEKWVHSIKKQCDERNIAFFFKQWGTLGCGEVMRSVETNGNELNGEIYQAMPEVDVMAANGLLF